MKKSNLMSQLHPEQHEWMEWLYRDCDQDSGEALQRHLNDCDACAAQVERWRRVMRVLDESTMIDAPSTAAAAPATSGRQWQLLTMNRRPFQSAVVIALLLIAAFSGGAAASLWRVAPLDEQQLRVQLVDAMRADIQELVRREMDTRITDEQQLLPLIHSESGRIVAARLAGWAQQDSQRSDQLQQVLQGVLRNQIALREDLETLAVEAEAQILQTRRELVRVSVEGNTAPPYGNPLPLRSDIERY
jgi:hypothetical protein